MIQLLILFSFLNSPVKDISAIEIINLKKKDLVGSNPVIKSWGFKPQFFIDDAGVDMAYSYHWKNKKEEYIQFNYRTDGDGGLESISVFLIKEKKMNLLIEDFKNSGFTSSASNSNSIFGKYASKKYPEVTLKLIKADDPLADPPGFLLLISFSN